jgi:hypothetical protein
MGYVFLGVDAKNVGATGASPLRCNRGGRADDGIMRG